MFSDLLDGYQNKNFAPGHLLTGIGNCLLETCFLEISKADIKHKFDMPLCCALGEIGMDGHTTVLNYGKGKLCISTMSIVYDLITMLSVAIEMMGLKSSPNASFMTNTLLRLVRLFFQCPDKPFDCVKDN